MEVFAWHSVGSISLLEINKIENFFVVVQISVLFNYANGRPNYFTVVNICHPVKTNQNHLVTRAKLVSNSRFV